MGQGRAINVVLLGAGDRGRIYADWIRSDPRLRIVAVADPVDAKRDYIRTTHNLSASACYPEWGDALAAHRSADAVIVATQDRMHLAPARIALGAGAHVLLEKPMAPTREEVLEIAREARASSGSLTVCHVLRYSSFFRTVKEVVQSGLLGDVQSILLAENVSYYHFAHSYVRGNWRNSALASPLILAKSCHDLDLLCWLADAAPEWVSSTSGLDFFTPRHAPDGAPERCTDGCPAAEKCLYESRATYLRGVPLKNAVAGGKGVLAAGARLSLRHPRLAARLPGLASYAVWKEWPTSTITTDLTETGILAALEDSPYGRCVFRCDNDQPDHQETIIRFRNGITAAFRLHGRSSEEGRTIRIDGSNATLKGRFGSGTVLELFRHGRVRPERIPVAADRLGHSEADRGIMEAWAAMACAAPGADRDSGATATDVNTAVASHLLAFAAHDSARTGEAVRLRDD